MCANPHVPRRAGIIDILTDAQGAAGLNVSALARVLGVDPRVVRRWYAGTRTVPASALRLAWAVSRHPELADELTTAFGESE